jgi:hypothetical protein
MHLPSMNPTLQQRTLRAKLIPDARQYTHLHQNETAEVDSLRYPRVT